MNEINISKILATQGIQVILIFLSTLMFFILERRFPGRELPETKGWYLRAVLMNIVQITLIGIGGLTWNTHFRQYSLVQLGNWHTPITEGLTYWFFGTFVFYWWHRLRHANGFWVVFHQIHHSPTRIELLTSFYKHPVEILADSVITSFFLFFIFGATAEAAAWTSFFGATGEYFYHSNIRTPKWFGYFLQRPEHHSIHHQLDVHKYNYGDITWWDRMFGTFKEADDFAPNCGFPNNNERRIWEMLRFKDVYDKR
ncbi:sterol desaturase family protein [Hymenobacter lucidus]|uniref:Sterol desaturase family protein n=1 Tax=Hymenobacter lucidus TaxID=2880930 RepID=A0ABS8AR98_9BACT|nr:sterol desaturase family protein [Hymenobacter lucidus]MCB2408743.1 sterol desaturase family protein [Hymenobacter lucidus]